MDGSSRSAAPPPPPPHWIGLGTHRDSIDPAVWRAVHCPQERPQACACAAAQRASNSGLQRRTQGRGSGGAGVVVDGGGFGAEGRVRPWLSSRGWPQSREPAFPPYFFPVLSLPLPHLLSPALLSPIDPSAALPAAQGREDYGRDPIKTRLEDRIAIKRRPISRGLEGWTMLGARCMDRTAWTQWLWCRSRSGRGTGCYRLPFEPLSHACARPRSFHHKHKTHCPAPQSPRPGLENVRAATGFPNSCSTHNKAPRSPSPSPLFGLHLRIASAFGPSYRFYSSRSITPTMAEVKWTGPLVRKTFLDFFAERGHSIGRTRAPPLHCPSNTNQQPLHRPSPPRVASITTRPARRRWRRAQDTKMPFIQPLLHFTDTS